MYANLKVSLEDGEPIPAWKVEVGPTTTVVHVDDNDGQSNYAVEGAVVEFDRATAMKIEANF